MTVNWRRKEKAIEADIIAGMRDLGFAVTKTSQPRPSMLTRGIPDLYVQHSRWRIRLWIEVKTETGKPSTYQAAWHQSEREAGGDVMIARSVGDVLDHLRGLGAPIR